MANKFVPKGYFVPSGYIGFLRNGSKMLFESEDAYMEYIEEA